MKLRMFEGNSTANITVYNRDHLYDMATLLMLRSVSRYIHVQVNKYFGADIAAATIFHNSEQIALSCRDNRIVNMTIQNISAVSVPFIASMSFIQHITLRNISVSDIRPLKDVPYLTIEFEVTASIHTTVPTIYINNLVIVPRFTSKQVSITDCFTSDVDWLSEVTEYVELREVAILKPTTKLRCDSLKLRRGGADNLSFASNVTLVIDIQGARILHGCGNDPFECRHFKMDFSFGNYDFPIMNKCESLDLSVLYNNIKFSPSITSVKSGFVTNNFNWFLLPNLASLTLTQQNNGQYINIPSINLHGYRIIHVNSRFNNVVSLTLYNTCIFDVDPLADIHTLRHLYIIGCNDIDGVELLTQIETFVCAFYKRCSRHDHLTDYRMAQHHNDYEGESDGYTLYETDNYTMDLRTSINNKNRDINSHILLKIQMNDIVQGLCDNGNLKYYWITDRRRAKKLIPQTLQQQKRDSWVVRNMDHVY
jgi:hypothetical protein